MRAYTDPRETPLINCCTRTSPLKSKLICSPFPYREAGAARGRYLRGRPLARSSHRLPEPASWRGPGPTLALLALEFKLVDELPLAALNFIEADHFVVRVTV